MGSTLSVNHWNGARLECIINYIKQIQTNNNIPYISVGSGTGFYEKLIMDRVPETKIICIDNFHDTYEKEKMVIKPEFSTVDDMIHVNPDISANCNLLLFWPYSEGLMPKNGTPYDVGAINQLKPKKIIILYEEFGASGSDLLHAWLSQLGAKNSGLPGLNDIDMVNELILTKYKLIAQDRWHHGTPDFLHFGEKSMCTVYLESTDEVGAQIQNEEPFPWVEHEYKDEIDVNLVFKEALKDLIPKPDESAESTKSID